MKTLVTATVIAALAVAALVGGVARESRSATPVAPAPVEAEALRAGFAPGDTQALVRRLQADVAARPDDARSLALLGLAYAQRARETGDAAYVSRADRALRRAVKLEPKDFEALTGLGSVALTRHRFRDALAIARRAHRRAHRARLRRTASSATRCSSSAATRPRSQRSTGWPR